MSCFLVLVGLILSVANLLGAIAIITFGGHILHYANILAYVTTFGDVILVDFFGPNRLKFMGIAIIVVGCVALVTSFFGCCGFMSGNTCLIGTYAILMLLLALFTFIFAMGGSAFYDEAGLWMMRYLRDIFYDPPHPIQDETINGLQHTIKCCGDYGPEFYNGTTISFDEHILEQIYEKLNIIGVGLVSPSCCSTIDLSAFLDDQQNYLLNEFQCTSDDVYREGCMPKLEDYLPFIDTFSVIVFRINAGVTICSFLFGMCMCTVAKNRMDDIYPLCEVYGDCLGHGDE